MRKYIFRLITFITPLVLITFFLLIIARKHHQFQPSSMYYYKEFEHAFQGNDFDIVAIGNSKLLSALDKKTLEGNNKNSVANLGFSSANMSVSKLTLESYLNNCSVKPKLVLLEVSWFSFNIHRTHLHKIVGDLFIRDLKLWKNYFNYDGEIILPKIKNAFGISLKRSVGIEQAHEELSYANRFKASSPQTINYKFNVNEFEFHFPNHIAGIDELLLNDFYSIVNLCKNENIDLVLFTAPEDEVYSNSQKDIGKIKSIFHNVSNNSPNVFYFDYTLGGELYDKNFEKWLRNSHHINENILFTQELLKNIKVRTGSKVLN